MRSDLDITAQQLAAAVGISRQYLSAIESGHANPTLGLVERIGDVLETEL